MNRIVLRFGQHRGKIVVLMLDGDSNPDPADALARIVDDEEEMLDARRWAIDQLLAGETPEDVCQQMMDEGWDSNGAESIVKFARKQTRIERGVVTREDVLRDLNADYRRATAGLSVSFRSGLFGLYGFTTGFMAALRQLRKLKQIGRSRK